MRTIIRVAIGLLSVMQQACAAITPATAPRTRVPQTLGELTTAYGYVPVDALAVYEDAEGPSCKVDAAGKKPPLRPLLEALPDISVRFAVGSFTANGGVTFGPAKVTAEGSTYRAVLDYINVDVVPVDFLLRKVLTLSDSAGRPTLFGLRLTEAVAEGKTYGYEARLVYPPLTAKDTAERAHALADLAFVPVTVPVYIGMGMRLTADLRALKSGVGLTSLGGIAAEAQAGALAGTLTVQTLGITGKAIATALPLPSKLDQTTIENAILAIGSSRAALYGSADTSGDLTRTPRVVGIYSPVGSDPALINAIYSELSRTSVAWYRPCART